MILYGEEDDPPTLCPYDATVVLMRVRFRFRSSGRGRVRWSLLDVRMIG